MVINCTLFSDDGIMCLQFRHKPEISVRYITINKVVKEQPRYADMKLQLKKVFIYSLKEILVNIYQNAKLHTM